VGPDPALRTALVDWGAFEAVQVCHWTRCDIEIVAVDEDEPVSRLWTEEGACESVISGKNNHSENIAAPSTYHAVSVTIDSHGPRLS
jgi:hypothetical protein